MEVIVFGTKRKELIRNIEFTVQQVFKEIKKQGSLAVHLVGQNKIKFLNKKTRGIDRVTDVLSFPLETKEDWGDIFICLDKIKEQAKEFKIEAQEEFNRLLIHGVLHLSGLDHDIEKRAKKMFKLQEKILKKVL